MTDHLSAAAYRALHPLSEADEHEIDAATYRARYGGTANDLVPGAATPKPRKYRNEPTEVDGRKFDSLAEARRYRELTWLRDAGKISQLRLQPRYPIVVNGVKICEYVADFEYLGQAGMVLEDVKGVKTAVYKLKKRLMLAVHGIDITEVGR